MAHFFQVSENKKIKSDTIFTGRFVLVLLLVLLSGVLPSAGEDESDMIRLGMSAAFSGYSAYLGHNIKTGISAAIDEVNYNQDLHGKKLSLIALDDGYEPDRSVKNVYKLIQEKNVLCLIGNVGTPTSVASIPISMNLKTLFFGAYTGAGALRKTPPDRYVINYRASYSEETEAIVNALIQHAGIKPHEIAFFTQRDSYGDAGYFGAVSALRNNGLKENTRIIHGRYNRNSLAVEYGIAEILMADPDPKAIIMVGAYAQTAQFIRKIRKGGLDPILISVSFVGADPLAAELKSEGNRVIVTQVVPHYLSDVPVASDFRNSMAGHDQSEMTFGAFEGYIITKILVEALKNSEEKPTREGLISNLEKLNEFDVGMGIPLKITPEEHQASHVVWPTVLMDGNVLPYTWEMLADDHE